MRNTPPAGSRPQLGERGALSGTMMRRAATLLSMLSMLVCVDSMRIVRPAISRRPFFAAATAAALAASPVAAQGGLSAGALAQAGMEAFRENRVADSIDLFDAADARTPK